MFYFTVIPRVLFSVIPSEVEESRGNGLVMFWVRFREMKGQAQHDKSKKSGQERLTTRKLHQGDRFVKNDIPLQNIFIIIHII